MKVITDACDLLWNLCVITNEVRCVVEFNLNIFQSSPNCKDTLYNEKGGSEEKILVEPVTSPTLSMLIQCHQDSYFSFYEGNSDFFFALPSVVYVQTLTYQTLQMHESLKS